MPTYKHLETFDPEIMQLVRDEETRMRDGLTIIPSENHISPAALEALATTLTDKYAEGYPGKRYYSGNSVVDKVELLAQERARNLFGVPYVNVQPYSGSPANLAAYLATCEPGESIMGLDLRSGGHLTHGWKFNVSAKFWKSHSYYMTADGQFDIDDIRRIAHECKPKLISCGGTAVPRAIPFAKFAEIADEVGAYLLADVSHIAGLIAGGQHESPAPYAHIIMTTTHKTLRGPRGALLMVTEKGIQKNPDLPEKIDKAIIPGSQGGPHMNTIASIAVILKEAAQPAFKDYARRIRENAQTLALELQSHGFDLVSGGTDNHLILVDWSKDGIGRGTYLSLALEAVGIYANKNAIPHDKSNPIFPSGLRMGTPAATTRGMGPDEMKKLAGWIKRVADLISDVRLDEDKELRPATMQKIKARFSEPEFTTIQKEVRELCHRFPIPTASSSTP